MTEFTTHTIKSAPENSRPLLERINKEAGFVPNLMAAMAESPATLEAYQNLSDSFDNTSFSTTERQLILLSISRFRNCCYCMAAHGTVAKIRSVSPETIDAVYYNQPLANSQYEALRLFTRAILEKNGWVDQVTLQRFYQAGYNRQHVLEVILAVSLKTLSNFVNHINDTPIDPQFISGLPSNTTEKCSETPTIIRH